MGDPIRPVRVMLVEDNPGDVFLFNEAIQQHSNFPVQIEVIADGESAARLLTGNGPVPDLVLLDLNLPKLDGFEVLQRLKDVHSRIPVIVLTSSESLRDMRAAYRLGASAYVTKPNDLDGVMRVVKGICSLWLEPIKQATAGAH